MSGDTLSVHTRLLMWLASPYCVGAYSSSSMFVQHPQRPFVVYTEQTIVTVSGREHIIWRDHLVQGKYTETLGYDDFAQTRTASVQCHQPNITNKGWFNLCYGFQALSSCVARWDHLPRTIRSISYIPDKSTLVRFEHGFHGWKPNIFTTRMDSYIHDVCWLVKWLLKPASDLRWLFQILQVNLFCTGSDLFRKLWNMKRNIQTRNGKERY